MSALKVVACVRAPRSALPRISATPNRSAPGVTDTDVDASEGVDCTVVGSVQSGAVADVEDLGADRSR
ncbi:hypothetical protein ACQPZ2_29035 [Nocardia pseudovaccinii]|uniref:hypothetical protein n=1 Tax=Nocardia pseudovaccinii TaxID=189540 RepID=UPI003D8C4D89